MTANFAPIFPLTSKIGLGQVSAANTNRDGSGTLVSVITGGTNGTRVHRITVKATVTTTAGMVRLYIYDGSSVTRLRMEIPVTAVTVSASAASFEYVIELFGDAALILPSGYILKASTHIAEAINVIAEAMDY